MRFTIMENHASLHFCEEVYYGTRIATLGRCHFYSAALSRLTAAENGQESGIRKANCDVSMFYCSYKREPPTQSLRSRHHQPSHSKLDMKRELKSQTPSPERLLTQAPRAVLRPSLPQSPSWLALPPARATLLHATPYVMSESVGLLAYRHDNATTRDTQNSLTHNQEQTSHVRAFHNFTLNDEHVDGREALTAVSAARLHASIAGARQMPRTALHAHLSEAVRIPRAGDAQRAAGTCGSKRRVQDYLGGNACKRCKRR